MARSESRAYKKGAPHRDYHKFIVVAEGEREDDYFRYFENISQRFTVAIVEREGGKSAVKYLMGRLENYREKEGIEPEDFVWFVLDVDRWPRADIDDLNEYCLKTPNWKNAISNICFEVWLYYHYATAIPVELTSPRSLKTALNGLIYGGYNRDNCVKLIKTAARNAETADQHPTHHYPDPGTTKLYKLANQLISFLGNKL